MDVSKIKLDNEVLIEENAKLIKKISKLEKNGLRNMDARLENIEEDVKWIRKRLYHQLLGLNF